MGRKTSQKGQTKTVIIQARYIDQGPLETFFGALFPTKATVRWERGHFIVEIPRGLKEKEIALLQERVELEHYAES